MISVYRCDIDWGSIYSRGGMSHELWRGKLREIMSFGHGYPPGC